MKERFGAIWPALALVTAAGATPVPGGPFGLAGDSRSGLVGEDEALAESALGPDVTLGLLPTRAEAQTWRTVRPRGESSSEGEVGYEGFRAREGFYVGGFVPFQDIGGDFDGDTTLVSSGGGEVILVPEFDPGLGLGVVAGWRTERVAFEMSYRVTKHEAEFASVEIDDAYLHAIDLDVKPYLSISERVQPFLLFGMSTPILVLEDARSEDGGLTFDEDATLTGFGFNFGGGVSVFADERLAVNLAAGYRLAWYFDAEGDEIDDDLDGHGFFASVGLSFTF